MTDVIVGHVVLHRQVIRTVHRHAAAVGVMDGSVLDVLPLASIADQMPVNGVASQVHVLTHAVQLHAIEEHLAADHRHDVAAKQRLVRVLGSLNQNVARQHADFAALIHVEGDLAKVHVVELLVERKRVATDGRDSALLGLMRIVIGRRKHDLVACLPACCIQNFDRVGSGFGRLG